jgi:glutamyl-tRNA synthetase
MNWTDPAKNELTEGFRERGFLPEAFTNLLALMGWTPGTEQEIFSLKEMAESFSLDRVHSAGAQFDFEKAKWYNHEWMKKLSAQRLLPDVNKVLELSEIGITEEKTLIQIIELVKDRCTLLADFEQQAGYFYHAPETIDKASILPKWDEKKKLFFNEFIKMSELTQFWDKENIENEFKEIAAALEIKTGDLMLPLRIMLVGGKFGPGVFEIAAIIGKAETIKRIKHALGELSS